MKNLKFKVTFKEQPEPDYSVPVTEMKLWQIGVMTHYHGDAGHQYAGSIVGWSHPGTYGVPTLHDINGQSCGACYGEHRLTGPDLGTRVRILKDGDTLVAGKDGALSSVKWAERPAKDLTIPVRELSPGQVGVITGWLCPGPDGKVVVRTSAGADRIQLLGEANGWGPVPVDDRCRVRPIGPGDRLEAVEVNA